MISPLSDSWFYPVLSHGLSQTNILWILWLVWAVFIALMIHVKLVRDWRKRGKKQISKTTTQHHYDDKQGTVMADKEEAAGETAANTGSMEDRVEGHAAGLDQISMLRIRYVELSRIHKMVSISLPRGARVVGAVHTKNIDNTRYSLHLVVEVPDGIPGSSPVLAWQPRRFFVAGFGDLLPQDTNRRFVDLVTTGPGLNSAVYEIFNKDADIQSNNDGTVYNRKERSATFDAESTKTPMAAMHDALVYRSNMSKQPDSVTSDLQSTSNSIPFVGMPLAKDVTPLDVMGTVVGYMVGNPRIPPGKYKVSIDVDVQSTGAIVEAFGVFNDKAVVVGRFAGVKIADNPQSIEIQCRYTGGTEWCDLGVDGVLREDFPGVYRIKPGQFPVEEAQDLKITKLQNELTFATAVAAAAEVAMHEAVNPLSRIIDSVIPVDDKETDIETLGNRAADNVGNLLVRDKKLEGMLARMIDLILPGHDTGDILADSKAAAECLVTLRDQAAMGAIHEECALQMINELMPNRSGAEIQKWTLMALEQIAYLQKHGAEQDKEIEDISAPSYQDDLIRVLTAITSEAFGGKVENTIENLLFGAESAVLRVRDLYRIANMPTAAETQLRTLTYLIIGQQSSGTLYEHSLDAIQEVTALMKMPTERLERMHKDPRDLIRTMDTTYGLVKWGIEVFKRLGWEKDPWCTRAEHIISLLHREYDSSGQKTNIKRVSLDDGSVALGAEVYEIEAIRAAFRFVTKRECSYDVAKQEWVPERSDITTVWHEGSKSFYRAALYDRVTPEYVVEESAHAGDEEYVPVSTPKDPPVTDAMVTAARDIIEDDSPTATGVLLDQRVKLALEAALKVYGTDQGFVAHIYKHQDRVVLDGRYATVASIRAAFKTLKSAGYTYSQGAEMYQPPESKPQEYAVTDGTVVPEWTAEDKARLGVALDKVFPAKEPVDIAIERAKGILWYLRRCGTHRAGGVARALCACGYSERVVQSIVGLNTTASYARLRDGQENDLASIEELKLLDIALRHRILELNDNRIREQLELRSAPETMIDAVMYRLTRME